MVALPFSAICQVVARLVVDMKGGEAMDENDLRPNDVITVSVNDFETKYVSRVSYDEMKIRLTALLAERERELREARDSALQLARIAAAFLEGIDEAWEKSDIHQAALANWRRLGGAEMVRRNGGTVTTPAANDSNCGIQGG
jgi:hypothetical protein